MKGITTDYVNGPHFPRYWCECADCLEKVGPWYKKSNAQKNLKQQRRCPDCEYTHLFNPPGRSPSLHG